MSDDPPTNHPHAPHTDATEPSVSSESTVRPQPLITLSSEERGSQAVLFPNPQHGERNASRPSSPDAEVRRLYSWNLWPEGLSDVCDPKYIGSAAGWRRKQDLEVCAVHRCTRTGYPTTCVQKSPFENPTLRTADLCEGHFRQIKNSGWQVCGFSPGLVGDFLSEREAIGVAQDGITQESPHASNKWIHVGPLCEIEHCTSTGHDWADKNERSFTLCIPHCFEVIKGEAPRVRVSLSGTQARFGFDSDEFFAAKCPGLTELYPCSRRRLPSERLCPRDAAFRTSPTECLIDDCDQDACSPISGRCDEHEEEAGDSNICLRCGEEPEVGQPINGASPVPTGRCTQCDELLACHGPRTKCPGTEERFVKLTVFPVSSATGGVCESCFETMTAGLEPGHIESLRFSFARVPGHEIARDPWWTSKAFVDRRAHILRNAPASVETVAGQ